MRLQLVLLRRYDEMVWYDRILVQHQEMTWVSNSRHVGNEEVRLRVCKHVDLRLLRLLFEGLSLLRQGRAVSELELRYRLAKERARVDDKERTGIPVDVWMMASSVAEKTTDCDVFAAWYLASTRLGRASARPSSILIRMNKRMELVWRDRR